MSFLCRYQYCPQGHHLLSWQYQGAHKSRQVKLLCCKRRTLLNCSPLSFILARNAKKIKRTNPPPHIGLGHIINPNMCVGFQCRDGNFFKKHTTPTPIKVVRKASNLISIHPNVGEWPHSPPKTANSEVFWGAKGVKAAGAGMAEGKEWDSRHEGAKNWLRKAVVIPH